MRPVQAGGRGRPVAAKVPGQARRAGREPGGQQAGQLAGGQRAAGPAVTGAGRLETLSWARTSAVPLSAG